MPHSTAQTAPLITQPYLGKLLLHHPILLSGERRACACWDLSRHPCTCTGEFSALVYVNCYIDDYYYYIEFSSSDSDVDAKAFTSDFLSIISTDTYGDFGNWISISISSEELWGESYYYSFSVDPDLTGEELKQFFIKYGESEYK